MILQVVFEFKKRCLTLDKNSLLFSSNNAYVHGFNNFFTLEVYPFLKQRLRIFPLQESADACVGESNVSIAAFYTPPNPYHLPPDPPPSPLFLHCYYLLTFISLFSLGFFTVCNHLHPSCNLINMLIH
jgi:hypothetical protein